MREPDSLVRRLSPVVSSSTVGSAPWFVVIVLAALGLFACAETTGVPSVPTGPRCGDGQIDRGEFCDDGNAAAGDGCSATCTIERGWTCVGEPSQCFQAGAGPVCGNGLVEDPEACDDGGRIAGDGCSAACTIEDGWRCAGEPSACVPLDAAPVCGNGLVEADEACDDGNVNANDGCSAACSVETGWQCVGEPSVCTEIPTSTTCGDGVLDEGEECDDGGTTPGDGCSAGCRVEDGWSCTGEPSVCERLQTCGDGVIDDGETCDDGNRDDGDGCSSTCSVEDGWVCDGAPSVCALGCEIPQDCNALRSTCANAICDVLARRCRIVPLPDGITCEAEGVCVDGGECVAGACQPVPLDCSSLDNACTVGVCSDATGACEAQPREEGSVCGRDEPCGRDVCRGGSCAWEEEPPCTECGDGDFCVGGACGGLRTDATFTFGAAGLPDGFRSDGAAPWNVIDDTTSPLGRAVRSGEIGNNARTSLYLDRDLVADATLTFRFRMGSEQCCDRLTLFVDGALIRDWGGPISWREESVALAAGSRTIEWRYSKDGSFATAPDAVFIDRIQIVQTGDGPCLSECGPGLWDGEACTVCDPVANGTVCGVGVDPCQAGSCEDGECVWTDVADGVSCGAADECGAAVCSAGACVRRNESDCTTCAGGTSFCASGVCGGLANERVVDFADGAFPADIVFAGALPWRIDSAQSVSGGFSARSGGIRDSQVSTMRWPVMLSEPGSVSFQYRTSSETCCDKLRFFINGTERLDVGGVANWRTFRFDLPAGSWTLEWRYTKDGSVSSFEDSVWVDDIRVSGLYPACEGVCGTYVFTGDSCIQCADAPAGTDCSDPTDPCRAGACEDGECVVTDVADGTVCGPSEGCTGLFCSSGACVTGPVPDGGVCGPGGLCTEDRCEAGSCIPIGVVDGAPCGDDLLCAAQQCMAGACEPVPFEDGVPCGDDLLCAAQQCVGGTCEPVPFEDGAPCGDDLLCAAQQCVGGTCEPVPFEDGVPCGDDLECAAQQCIAGACEPAPFDDCTPCDTGGSFCVEGVCGGLGSRVVWDFADGAFPAGFTFGGNQPWRIDTSSSTVGGFSARAGSIGNSQVSVMQTEIELIQPGTVSFKYRVSSETCCDKLRFLIDGVELLNVGGDSGWQSFTVERGPGTYVLQWRYTKDISSVQFLDTAWIDDIRVDGVTTACDLPCGGGVFDGVGCRVCDPVPNGTACSGEDDPCRVGRCEDGDCVFENVVDGTVCGDLLDTCTEQVCSAGACVPRGFADGTTCGETTDCAALACSSGTCQSVPAPDCTPCAGGTSACAGGLCGGQVRTGDELIDFADSTIPSDFTFAGNQPWRIDTVRSASAGVSIRSGTIGNSQSSTIRRTITLVSPGFVSFDYNVSSEACCDLLRFRVNGVQRLQQGGGDVWRTHREDLAPGVYELEWSYSKDISAVAGADAAWIDNLRFVGFADPCTDDRCGGALVFDGTTCLACTPAVDGTDCSDVDDPCNVGRCEDGRCFVEPAEDGLICGEVGDCWAFVCNAGTCERTNAGECTPCGDGTEFCGSGLCGGLSPDTFWNFAEGTFPEAFTFSGSPTWRLDTSQSVSGGFSARAGAIAANGSTSMSVRVTLVAPGEVSFRYRVSSETCCDLLRFFVNDTQRFERGGVTDWLTATYPLPAGTHVLRWNYSKDGSVTAGSDTAWVDEIRISGERLACSGECGPSVLTTEGCVSCDPVPDGGDCSDPDEPCRTGTCEGGVCEVVPVLDCTPCAGPDGASVCAGGFCGGAPPVTDLGPRGSFVDSGFTTGGNALWRLDVVGGPEGREYAQSGVIGNNGQTWLETVVDLPLDGQVSFLVEVGSEQNYDFGEFYVDGVRRRQWSGSVAWTRATFPLAAGTRTLRWRYTKDGGTAVAPDRMRVAGVEIEIFGLCVIEEACEVGFYNGSDCTVCPDPVCE